MDKNLIKHFCFDKDGIIIDVHAYWYYNSILRAEYIINYLKLDPSINGDLLWAMGINPNTRKIKKDGPVGYYPRNIVIKHITEFLKENNKKITNIEVSKIFSDLDVVQQKNNDYNVQILSGVKRCLQYLRRKGLFISIYTSDRHLNAKKNLDKKGIAELIHLIVGGDDVDKSKPHPEGFLKACNDLKVHPNQSVYVGDTVSDMVMGKRAAAAMVVGLETGLFKSIDFRKETKYIYPSMIEFNAEIKQYL